MRRPCLAAAAALASHALPRDGVSLLRDPWRTFARPMHWRIATAGARIARRPPAVPARRRHRRPVRPRADEHQRANLAGRDPARLADLRDARESWAATMPPMPEDATVSLDYGVEDMPQR